MSSRGGLKTLNDNQNKAAKIPVSTKVVKQSLKSIILSGESTLDKYISHRFLYLIGFINGWNPKVFSLEFLPIFYFLIWAIIMFALREFEFAYMFLISSAIILLYFIILHALISSWDKIKRWLIKRARKRGGVSNLTLEDVKFLLIYTRKIFGVKATVDENPSIEFNPDNLKDLLLKSKRWQFALNVSIIIELILLTSMGIYGFLINMNVMNILIDYWYYLFLFLVPIIIIIIGLIVSKQRIKYMINNISIEKIDEVLFILNEFQVYGGKFTK